MGCWQCSQGVSANVRGRLNGKNPVISYKDQRVGLQPFIDARKHADKIYKKV